MKKKHTAAIQIQTLDKAHTGIRGAKNFLSKTSKIVLATILNGILLQLKVIDFQIISLTSKHLSQSPALQYWEVELFDIAGF